MMTTGTGLGRPLEILLVEDSPTDADLAMEALKEGRVQNSVHHVKDGVEAMTFLKQEAHFTNAPRPDFVLLDLNMPKKDGREVLKEIRTDASLKGLIVIVLTTSAEDEDVAEAYRWNANTYITKPVDLDEFFDVVQNIELFWFTIATLSPGRDSFE